MVVEHSNGVFRDKCVIGSFNNLDNDRFVLLNTSVMSKKTYFHVCVEENVTDITSNSYAKIACKSQQFH